MEFSQIPVFNTKGADVVHEKNVPKISKCGEERRLELKPNPGAKWAERIIARI